jgi:stringent starvation protein B
MQPTRLPRKKDVVLQLLEQATVFVHLDPRGEAVRVPPWFKRQPQLVLQIGLNMAVPIPDLEVDDEGLSCTLSFNRAPFLCVIPWSSVFALVDDQRQGMVWPDDVPAELNQQAQQQQAKQQQARPELKVAPAPAAKESVKEAKGAKKETKGKDASAKRRTRKTAAAKAPRAAAKPARTPAQKPRAAAKPQAKRAAAPAAEKAPVQKAAPAPAPAQAPAAAAAGASKRKLPPYLRVVK